LPLDMNGNFPPSLFEALNRLERCSEEFGHLFLSLLEAPTERVKVFMIHRNRSFFWDPGCDQFLIYQPLRATSRFNLSSKKQMSDAIGLKTSLPF